MAPAAISLADVYQAISAAPPLFAGRDYIVQRCQVTANIDRIVGDGSDTA